MTLVDTGTYGAKRQSWKRANPRDLLKQIIDSSRGKGEEEIYRKFSDALHDERELIDSIIEYWFANNYRSIIHKEPSARVTATSENRISEAKKKIIAVVSRIVFMDMILPNGKKLRHCTSKDCIKAGGWLKKVGAKIRPGENVGQSLSEDQLQKIFRAA